jgi:hypothetical protein
MASNLLYNTDQPVVVQSGVAFQIATAQLYAKETISSNARLNTVNGGIVSTIINLSSFGIRGETVINDTPSPLNPTTNINMSYLYGGIALPSGSKMKRWDGTQWKSIDTLVVFK